MGVGDGVAPDDQDVHKDDVDDDEVAPDVQDVHKMMMMWLSGFPRCPRVVK